MLRVVGKNMIRHPRRLLSALQLEYMLFELLRVLFGVGGRGRRPLEYLFGFQAVYALGRGARREEEVGKLYI